MNLTTTFGGVIGAIITIMGWVLAQGFWSTFFAVLFPPWSWFVVIRHFLELYGVI